MSCSRLPWDGWWLGGAQPCKQRGRIWAFALLSERDLCLFDAFHKHLHAHTHTITYLQLEVSCCVQIPEGVAVALPLYYATGSKWKGLMWATISGAAEPLGGLIGYAVLSSTGM